MLLCFLQVGLGFNCRVSISAHKNIKGTASRDFSLLGLSSNISSWTPVSYLLKDFRLHVFRIRHDIQIPNRLAGVNDTAGSKQISLGKLHVVSF
jgi:hypothetical protein